MRPGSLITQLTDINLKERKRKRRKLFLESEGKVCSSGTSVNEFGLWGRSVEGKAAAWKCHPIDEAVDGYFHLEEMQ